MMIGTINLLNGISVFDSFTKKNYNYCLNNMSINSREAEYIALIYSLKIAVDSNYKHVVFVYDCLSLNLAALKEYANEKFITAQFLWLNRVFTKKADKLARIALRPSRKSKRAELIRKFSSYSDTQIIKASMYIANENQYKSLNIFLNNKYDIYQLPEFKSDDVALYRFIYHMLSKDIKEKFYEFIISINPIILCHKEFKGRPSNHILIEVIERILHISKEIKNAE